MHLRVSSNLMGRSNNLISFPQFLFPSHHYIRNMVCVCLCVQSGKSASYPQQCCRLKEHCNIADLLFNFLLLEPVGSFIPDIVAFTLHTDHVINVEIDAEAHFISLYWRCRQCVLPANFKVTDVRTPNMTQGKINANSPESHSFSYKSEGNTVV